MTENKRPKAFFLNGGMGRIISAIPALEKYQEANTCLLYTSPSPRD